MSSFRTLVSISIVVLVLIELGNAMDDIGGLVGIPMEARRKFFKNGPCSLNQFRCSNDECIHRKKYCNSITDCEDRSDEIYCSKTSCPSSHYMCKDGEYYARYIPDEWECDGTPDCHSGSDEIDCKYDGTVLNSSVLRFAKVSALNWTLEHRRNDLLTQKWGSDVEKIAVAWYLSTEEDFLEYINLFSEVEIFRSEITYELSLRLLSRMALTKIQDIPSTELALYVHAFLVTCIDPRNFYKMDLVEELRKRVDSTNNSNPFVTLALCNAGEPVTENDVEKLVDSFWLAQEKHWIDIQALAVLAIACATTQNPQYKSEIKPLTLELKEKQYRNGTIENLKTTALVMQALFASESEPDENNFDEQKALRQILQFQQSNGSFGKEKAWLTSVLHIA